MTSITVQTHRHVAAPRGAAWAAFVFTQAARGVEWLVRTRDTFAADRNQAQRTAEAHRVRRLARALGGTDPGFSADLYAAADRHERT